MYTYKHSKASLGSFELNGMPNPWGGIGDLGSSPCAIPASQECEDYHCPSELSRQPEPFCLWDCREDCRTYLRDKRAGNVTTKEELDRAARIYAEIRQEQNRIAQVNKENLETANRENEIRETLRVQKEKLDRNKKILIIGGALVGILAVGSFFLKQA